MPEVQSTPMMKAMKTALYGMGLSAATIIVAAGILATVPAKSQPQAEALADTKGNLRVPRDYRTRYEFLGTWSAAADHGPGAQELHTVYASPGTIAAYRRDGRFPGGTVLVKEVYKAATAPMTTGLISHAEGLLGWFVMMKDDKGLYAGNKLVWGDGWGWSWFDAANPAVASINLPLPGGAKATSADYRDNCKACHLPAQATDMIYVEGYPPLRR
jgi:Cytochrome P460